MHRSIVLAKGGQHWVFAYLYAKKDRANIDADELAAFSRAKGSGLVSCVGLRRQETRPDPRVSGEKTDENQTPVRLDLV
jgi:hypothetical protein